MKTLVLTGGGTAGHCLPNIALIPELKKYFDKIIYIGSKNGLEKNLAEENGLDFYAIPCAKLNRNITIKNFAIPFSVVNGAIKAGKILDKIKPNVIFSKGGYVAVPVIYAGKKRKIPIISHESDLSLGLANKITAKHCEKVLTSFPETAKLLNNGLYVGSPLRQSLFTASKKDALKKFKLTGEKPVILITGGSLGSKTINKSVKDALPLLLDKFDVIHQCGKNNLEKIKTPKGYIQTEFISDMNMAYACADVCVCRAGSNTIFELIALKKPCVLIPLPKGASRGDQVQNAEYFQKKGLVNVLPQSVLTPESLFNAITSSYANRVNIRKTLEQNKIIYSNEKIAEILSNACEKN